MRDEWISPHATNNADDDDHQDEANANNGRTHTFEFGAFGVSGAIRASRAFGQFTGASDSTNSTDTTDDAAVNSLDDWDESEENTLGLRIQRINPADRELTPRQLARGLLVATLIAVLIGGVVSWPSLAPIGTQAFGRVRATLFPTPPPRQVWTPIAPSYAQSVAFGVNAPQTGYLCGAQGVISAAPNSQVAAPASTPAGPGAAVGAAGEADEANHPDDDDLRAIALGVSRDSGHSWRTVKTPAYGSDCVVSVNPTNARDIVLLSVICALCDATQVQTRVWRSRDAGQTWAAIAPPRVPNVPNASSGATTASAASNAPGAANTTNLSTTWPVYVGRITWAGGALYLAAFPGLAAKAQLAVCPNASACSWVDLSRVMAGEPSGLIASPLSIEGMNNTLYMQLTSQQRCPPACVRDATSSDGGATWTPFAPTFRGQPVQPRPESHGAPDLLGYYQAPDAPTESLISSSDGGVTWHIRPNPPSGLFTQQILESPDGTIYAWMTQASNAAYVSSGKTMPQGIYALAPNGKAWRLVAPEQTSQSIAILALSCDAHGHAQAIWGNDLSVIGVAQPSVMVHWL